MHNKELNKDILKYVSNLDKDIYSVSNLPEEIIAVIFAYVSRSPLSFRENITKVTEEKASKFHEKWVLNFGHSSVAELAVAHICVENVSRLFSSILERANLFISPIEFSQRYQKPKKGAFYVPSELLNEPKLKDEYINFNNYAYDVYENLNKMLLEYHLKINTKGNDENEKEYIAKWEKIAFEDARYVLPLAVHTNLGFSANGRALENLISKLLSNKYLEVRTRAEEIKSEAKKVLPTLVKYANENGYFKSFYTNNLYHKEIKQTKEYIDDVRLIDDGHITERQAILSIITPIIYSQKGVSYFDVKEHLSKCSDDELINIFNNSIKQLGTHDELWDAFHQIKYTFELAISEACWHQILRHRKIDFYETDPNTENSFVIPPRIREANLDGLLIDIMLKSNELYKKLKQSKYPDIASYVVTNAHKRLVVASVDLWEFYNLTNLRLTQHAQWDIKNIVNNMYSEINKIHPNIVKPILDRIKDR